VPDPDIVMIIFWCGALCSSIFFSRLIINCLKMKVKEEIVQIEK
jgi:hypothetical protein